MISPCLIMELNGNWPRNLGEDPGGNRPKSRSGSDRSDGDATRSRALQPELFEAGLDGGGCGR
jgi:hypothetical protein